MNIFSVITSSCDDSNDDYEWQETRLTIMTAATSIRTGLIAHVNDLWEIIVYDGADSYAALCDNESERKDNEWNEN